MGKEIIIGEYRDREEIERLLDMATECKVSYTDYSKDECSKLDLSGKVKRITDMV